MTERIEIRQGETTEYSQDDQAIADNLVIEGEETSGTEERPEWLPEKFSSVEAMAQAYQALEAKQSQQASNETEDATEDEYEYEEDTSEGAEDASEYAEELTNESIAEYSQEFNNTGQLSAESYEQIQSRFGIPKNIAEAYVQGQQAMMRNHEMGVMASVGGPENYGKMISWGQKSLPEQDRLAFDDALKSGNSATINNAVQGMWARYQGSTGTRGKLIEGRASSNPNNSFGSIAELTAAMKDPRYAKDPAYRKDIQNRLDASNIM
jgi:hypothetical protein